MSTIEEKRVYGESEAPTDAYVASETGLVRVSVAGDLVGEFSLCVRHPARDVAAGGDLVVAATDEDVLVATLPDGPEAFEPTQFGPAAAVGIHRGTVLAAAPNGRLAQLVDDEWEGLGLILDYEVSAIDGDLVATDGGLYRIRDSRLEDAGLSAVRDVSTAAVPLAVTADGLYRLGNGWMQVHDGPVDVVDAAPADQPGRLERAHAVADDVLLEYADGSWTDLSDGETGTDLDDAVVGFAYGETTYAVTTDGVFLAATPEGWRSRRLGVTGVTGIACPRR
ncbi:hypothetical protein OB905_13380 [Halobacteria archaeon AArc-dxtr1]|nr:hypothetical protein [Halobacteria archaeon AArc-dxtr1]